MTKKINYTIIGQGELQIDLYPNPSKLYGFLKTINYEIKFKHTNQLGSLTNYLPGAHHTRYEYILLQWYLINLLKQSNRFGLSAKNNGLFGVDGKSKVSNAEVLQTLSILTNMGHFPGTFAVSRTWLDILDRNEKKARSGLRDGLEAEDRKILDEYINEFSINKIHLLNSLFLLNRYKRRIDGELYINYSKNILIAYIEDEERLANLWKIYDYVRKIAFLILDSSYAPLAVNITVQSIKDNIIEIFDELIKNNSSSLINTIDNINNTMEESLYMSSKSLLTVCDYSKFIKRKFDDIDEVFEKRSKVRTLLEPDTKRNEISNAFQRYYDLETIEPRWENSILEVKYSNIGENLIPRNYVKWERELERSIGNVHIGSGYMDKGKIFKVVCSQNKSDKLANKFRKTMDIISKLYTFEDSLNNEMLSVFYEENSKKILNYVLNNVFQDEKYYKFEYDIKNEKRILPFFRGRGSKTVMSLIEEYKVLERKYITADQIHEIDTTIEYLKKLSFKGEIFAFVGATKVYGTSMTTEEAEFDGIVVIPGQKKVCIIESKNTTSACSQARRQLKKRSQYLNKEKITFKISDIDKFGAVIEITELNIDK